MHAIHYRYADVHGRRLFYREVGASDAPAVVLLHGFPASSFMFRAATTRSSAPQTRPAPRSACSTAAISCSKATSTPPRASSAALWTGPSAERTRRWA